MKINIRRHTSRLVLLQFLATLFLPFATIAPRAAAAAITWSGGGTPVVDTDLKTITFDMSDTGNWDGGVVPVDGDSWNFPANLANVDPGDAYEDDYSWKYIVNNDLQNDTADGPIVVAGISFTGDADAGGTACYGSDRNDAYLIDGNDILLHGDVTNNYTGSCGTSMAGEVGVFVDNVTVEQDTVFQADLGDNYNGLGEVSLTYDTHNITFRPAGYGQGAAFQALVGTGTITVDGSSGVDLWLGGHATSDGQSALVVEMDSSFTLTRSQIQNKLTQITVRDGANLNISASGGSEFEITQDIVFEGEGTSYGLFKSNDPDAESETLEGYRMSIYNASWDAETQKNEYFPVVFSGDITLSSDTLIAPNTDVTISGALNGEYALSVLPGSRGSLTVTSSDNNSATPNGELTPERIAYTIVDPGNSFDVYIGYGNDAMLTEDITNNVILQEGARLKGQGSVGGLEVQVGAWLAPGNSPGCINSTDGLTLAGTFEAEIAGTTACSGYDQTGVEGDVDITGSTLDLTLLNDFVPAVGNQFTIISNDGSDAVTGQFDGLDEGGEVEIDGVTFTISYEGGDGNDVVLTVTALAEGLTPTGEAAPGVPDTGVGSIITNPFVSIFAATIAAGTLLASRKLNSAKK